MTDDAQIRKGDDGHARSSASETRRTPAFAPNDEAWRDDDPEDGDKVRTPPGLATEAFDATVRRRGAALRNGEEFGSIA